MKVKELFIIISNIKGIGLTTVNKILIEFNKSNDLRAVLKFVAKLKIANETKIAINEAFKHLDHTLLAHKNYMKLNRIELVTVEDHQAAYALKNIHNPPKYLYGLGDLACLDNCIAVIGARNCSDYGRKMAFEIGKQLALYNFTVVSGMAYGIDTCAHKGALSVGGKTIAVLGSGLSVCYPKSNQNLFNEIKNSGLLISEYGFNTQPSKFTFPQRNRIISGLCKAIIVVEAKERSGTMITVQYGLDQGRQIFAVPGNINSSFSKGTNQLLKAGAIPYTNIIDILENVN